MDILREKYIRYVGGDKFMSNKNVLLIIMAIIMFFGGLLIIPKLIKKCTAMTYKKSLNRCEGEIDSMGPKIVKKEE